MQSSLDDFEKEPNLRPTLLTVLCILTFIGSGWTIISGAFSYSTASRSAVIFSSARNQTVGDSTIQSDPAIRMKNDSGMRNGRKNRGPFGVKMMASLSKVMTEDNIRKNAIGNIISALLTLLGAFLMWRLKRSGFYLYIFGVIVGLVVPFYLYGNNLLAVGISSATTFFGLVFIALYALNIKNLR
jgi:hypothetical protein